MDATNRSLRVERTIPAPPTAVFAAWTTPSELVRWWTPPQGRCAGVEIDLQPGGTYAIVNELADGQVVTISGQYIEIDPPHRLRFTWSVGDASQPTEIVTVTFVATGGDTRVTILHDEVSDPDTLAGHDAGWQSCLDGLAAHASADLRPPNGPARRRYLG